MMCRDYTLGHRLSCMAALALTALLVISCEEAPPPPPPRPAADITVPPGLSLVADIPDAVLFSGAAVSGESATPLFRGRLTSRGSQGFAAPGAPAGATVRLRFVAAPVVQRGEEMNWIKSDGPLTELPKTGGTAEYVYPGGTVFMHLARDEAGKLSVVEEKAAPGKK